MWDHNWILLLIENFACIQVFFVDDDINYKKKNSFIWKNYDWGLSKIMTHFILGEIEILWRLKKLFIYKGNLYENY